MDDMNNLYETIGAALDLGRARFRLTFRAFRGEENSSHFCEGTFFARPRN